MAIKKLSDFGVKTEDRRLLCDPQPFNKTYVDSNGAVTVVPHLLITLEDGTKGYTTLERYAEMLPFITPNENGELTLSKDYDLGKTKKEGMDHPYWYNKAKLLSAKPASISIVPDVV